MHGIRKLVKDLDELCQELDEKYDINHGGCCFVASVIAKNLEELGIEFNLVIADSSRKNKKFVYHELNNHCLHLLDSDSVCGISNCNHYYIHIKYGGPVNLDDDYIHVYSFKCIPARTIKWIYAQGGWNRQYDTNNNRIVSRKINSFFKQYK
jgi:hypothetical protein